MLPFCRLSPPDGGVNLKMRGLTAGGIELPKFKAKKGRFAKLFECMIVDPHSDLLSPSYMSYSMQPVCVYLLTHTLVLFIAYLER